MGKKKVGMVELLTEIGDEGIKFNALDTCITKLTQGRRGTRVIFTTDQPFSVGETKEMGVVLWLDRVKVAEILDR